MEGISEVIVTSRLVVNGNINPDNQMKAVVSKNYLNITCTHVRIHRCDGNVAQYEVELNTYIRYHSEEVPPTYYGFCIKATTVFSEVYQWRQRLLVDKELAMTVTLT